MTTTKPGANWSNPIWYRKYRIYATYDFSWNQYEFVHDDWEPGDPRCGRCNSVDECKEAIDNLED